MGLITQILSMVFGGGRNALTETVEVFRENSERGAERSADAQQAAITQFAAEFARVNKGPFDRFVDGLNRLPRPILALSTIGLFASAMTDPIWFATRMDGVRTVPEPLWWLMGVVVSFYFGARHQIKGQEFNRDIVQAISATTATHVPRPKEIDTSDNAALQEWVTAE